MVKVIVSHDVKDFAAWKKVFDGDQNSRTQNNVKADVFTSDENPNAVTVIAEFPNAEVARGFMSNPELQATMEKAGVIGKPDIKVLNKV